MPKVSKAGAATQQDIGIGRVSEEVVDGYVISFLDIREGMDMAPLLKGLPDDRCPCPHWGYVIKGAVTFTFADRMETFTAGDEVAPFCPSWSMTSPTRRPAWSRLVPRSSNRRVPTSTPGPAPSTDPDGTRIEIVKLEGMELGGSQT